MELRPICSLLVTIQCLFGFTICGKTSDSSRILSVFNSDSIFSGLVMKVYEPKESHKIAKTWNSTNQAKLVILVSIRTVYRGDRSIEKSLCLVVEVDFKRHRTPTSTREGDTKIFLTNRLSSGVFELAVDPLSISVANLKQLWKIRRAEDGSRFRKDRFRSKKCKSKKHLLGTGNKTVCVKVQE